jgi:hypothetical protein
VLEGLERLLTHKAEIQKMEKGGLAWFLEYCVQQPLAQVIKIIKQKELKGDNAYSL